MNVPEHSSPQTGKIVFDYCAAVICLVLLLPVILILALAIKLSGKGPVIYSQERIGKDGVPFRIYKFRSMQTGIDEGLILISGKEDKRITPIGRFMRKHKLDEIPNFLNVLKGEMSIVGPRPEQRHYIDQIVLQAPQYYQLHDLKPGITSWGQVKYGYAVDVPQMTERLEYDLYYLENRSLWFDLKIILYTVGIIFRGEGV